MFHYVLVNEWPFFIFHDFTFYSKIALRPISHVARVFAAKMLVATMLGAEMVMVRVPRSNRVIGSY